MSESQYSLSRFTAECGTTDDARETVHVGDPDDGHRHHVNEIDPYWSGQRELEKGGTWACYSLVPAGRFTVVLETDADVVTQCWTGDGDGLERGVYLPAKENYGNRPPKPVAVSDAHLKFGAEAAIRAADAICPDDDIVAISKSSWAATLLIGVRNGSKDIETVFNGGDGVHVGAFPSEQPELFKGFHHIRKKDASPFEVYSKAEAPRLRLVDLDWTIGQAGGR
jgi:hypothetical protein